MTTPLASTDRLTAFRTPDGRLEVHDRSSGRTATYSGFGELSDSVEATPLDDELKRLVVAVARALAS